MHFTSSLLAGLALGSLASATDPAKIFRIAEKYRPAHLKPRSHKPAQKAVLEKRGSRWLTDKTKPFEVDGKNFPDTTFDIGESYSGLLPISDHPDETRKLFFWFFPTANPAAGKELTFWFNGGPGCSSLSGFLTENGKFLWDAGTLAPVENPYSWTNLTNMVWIEQPVGVGYTQGTPDITNEVELADQLVGFYRQFMKTFATEEYGIYITGESYAGYYAPYISNAFITANDTNMPFKGMAINDPIIGDSTTQQMVPILAFVEYWQKVFYLNDTFMERFRARHQECGYTDYMEKYLQFPPPHEKFPVLPDPYASENATCDQLDNASAAITAVNPCFDIYNILEQCPFTYSHLGIVNPGDYSPPGATIFFNRTDVKKALHAPLDSNWLQCTNINVFGGPTDNQNLSDTSLGPAQDGVLQNVIDFSKNVLIGSGELDGLLTTNGTLLALQNTTWGGMQGFQKRPSNNHLYVPYHPEYNRGALAGAGFLGTWGHERGLTFYTAQLAGHELPGYTPGVGYRALEILLGRVKDFSSECDFSTQKGNFTGTTPLYRN